MIAVTFALPAESSDFLRHLRNQSRTDRSGIRTIRGTIDDRTVEVLHTGVGEKACRQRVANFLRGQQFDLLISTGFAGALNDQLQVGDLLLAKNFSTVELTDVGSSFSRLPIHEADLLTVSALIESSEKRLEIARASGAAAVDMETEFIARACADYGIPLLSLRVISDTLDEPFPAPPNVLFDIEQQRTRFLTLARFFLAHPNRLPRLVQFARRIAKARKTLADALVALINKL
jgi:nucleoside phosphorylase